MDPFVLLDQAERQGTIPKALSKKVHTRAKYLTGAVQRVEKASGLAYPPYYVEPALPVSQSGVEFGQMGVLYARVIPTTATGTLTILVQFSAALLAFGTKGTIDAVAAHEFTHYVDLVRRLSRTDVLSDERSSTLFEAAYADSEKTVPPKLLFKEKALVGLVSRKFKQALVDEKLNKSVGDKWIAKNLPMRRVAPEENVIRVGVGAVLKTSFDPAVLRKVSEIQEQVLR